MFVFFISSIYLTHFRCVETIYKGEHPAAMQHNSADKHFVVQPMLVLPLATIAAGGAAIATNFMATLTVIIAAMSSILLNIWIVLARFRKNFSNTMLWPSASVWVVR